MARLAHPLVRAALIGTCGGIAVLAVLLLWRGKSQDVLEITVEEASNPHEVTVWVGGAVTTPGLLTLELGSRVADAVEMAGGLTQDADARTINMAAPLNDAQHIEIPRAAAPPAANSGSPPAATQSPGMTGSTGAPAAGTAAAVISAPSVPTLAPPATTGSLLNINLATASELEALPEIGATLAQRIIDYRTTHGPYTSVDQLEAIDGISMRIVEILRPLVTVGP